MPGPPAAEWNMVHHPQTLPRERVRSSRSHEEKEHRLSRKRALQSQTSRRSALNQPSLPTRRQNPNHRGTQWPIGNLEREDGLERQVHRYKSRQPVSLTRRRWFTSWQTQFFVSAMTTWHYSWQCRVSKGYEIFDDPSQFLVSQPTKFV